VVFIIIFFDNRLKDVGGQGGHFPLATRKLVKIRQTLVKIDQKFEKIREMFKEYSNSSLSFALDSKCM